MCCFDDDPPKFYHAADRRARKAYRCDECRRAITPGERYTAHSGLWDGGFLTFRWCDHCGAAAEAVNAMVSAYNRARGSGYAPPEWCRCWAFGEFWNEVRDAVSPGRGGMPLARLVVAARRKWTYRRGPRKGELVPVPAAVTAVA